MLLGAVLGGALAAVVALRYAWRTAERERAAFLGEAATVLLPAADRASTARTAASLPVPWLADWCAVDLVDEDGAPRRAALHHGDPALEDQARRLHDDEDPFALGAAEALRAGRLRLWPEVPDAVLAGPGGDERRVAALRALGAGSALFVPLRTVDRTVGVMTLVAREPARFAPADVELVEDLARRCATALARADTAAAPAASPGRFER